MLISSSQYNRIVSQFKVGCPVSITKPPNEFRSGELEWTDAHALYVGGKHVLEQIICLDRPVMSDGRVLYEIAFTLRHEGGRYRHSFALDWIDDSILQEILGTKPQIKIEAKSNPPAQKEEIGMGATVGGLVAAILGMTALKKRKGKIKEAAPITVEEKVDATRPA